MARCYFSTHNCSDFFPGSIKTRWRVKRFLLSAPMFFIRFSSNFHRLCSAINEKKKNYLLLKKIIDGAVKKTEKSIFIFELLKLC